MPCKDGSGILQNINLSEVDVNRCLLSYCSSNSSKNTDKRTIGMASSRQSAACSTESTNNRPFPYKEETSRTCDVEDSELHLEHSASENNVKCISATDSKIDTMKEMQNQLTTLTQLNPSRNIYANKKTGRNDVQSGGNDVLKNNFSVAAKSLSSINKPSDAVTGGDVLPLEKCEQTDASETCTVTNPIHRVGSNGLLVQEKSHAIRPKATMSSNDLLKLLRKFNMTLKAVPADSEIAKIIAKSARKFNGTIAYSHDSSSLHDSNKANGFRPVKCLPSKRLNKVTQPGDRCRLHCKTTCTGTFSKWKLDESYLKSRSAYSNNNGDSKADHERGDSRLRTSSTAKFPKRQLPLCRKLNSIQGRSENTFNNDAKCAKGSSASYAHMPLHDIPLAKAFDDLKNRDKAIRETLEIFTEEGSEHKSMSGCAKDSLLDSINSKNDPLLTTAAFQSGNDEMDEFSFRVSTVIIKPKKPSVDQNESCVKILPPESVDENWSHIDDTLFDVKKQSMKTAKPTSSTSIKIRHGDERSVSTRGKCGVLNTTDENIKLESMDVDHNYHRRDCDHLYSVKVEKWTPKEVLSWLSSTIQQFTESESAANDISSRKERHNLSEKLFSHVRDAEGLLSVTLDKLKQICSDDSLARYLFERVQALWTSRKKEGNGTASNMYSAGQCAISAPPLVNATSMEQLEESVNIDDLFTGDGMFGSVDFSDTFDSQTGSYLKYLGNDYVHAPASFLNHEAISANLFSAKTRPPASNQGEYNAIRYMQSQRHDSYAYSTHYDFHGAGFNSNSYISHDGKVSTSDRNFTVNSAVGTGGWSSSSTRSSDTHLYSTSMSPSTYYDLSTVGNGQSSLAHSNGCASTGQISESYHLHKARDPTCHYANVIVGFREVSDNDGDIHSPNIQSPNKHVGMNALPSRNMYQLPRDHHHRQNYALQKRYLPTSSDMKTSWTSSNEVAVSTQASFPCRNQCCDEKWDCSSTSSNTTAVSVGSESKLLNMDDCKSFHAYEFPENAPQNTHIMYSRPSSPIMDGFSLTENKSFCNETVETIVQRNVATIYPEFVTQVQRSVSMNKSGSCSPVEHDTISNMFHGDSLESNGDISSVLRSSDNEDRNNGVEYSVSGISRSRSVSNRRHTSDNTDSYVDNFDLKIRRTSGKSITLWEFIRDTLLDPQYCPRLIKWEDRKAGIFRFVQSDVVAGMWGDKKNNPKMTYEKLSRAMRYYYNRGILERVDGRRLVYKFGRNAHGWQQNEIDHSISSRYITEAKPVKRETIVNYPQPKIKPRKIKSCKIPVSHCDEIIPATKRRRESRETSPAYLSISSNNETQSSDTQFSTRFNDRANDDLASTTNGESLLSATCPAEDNRQTTPITSHDVTISDQPSCIVFVARQEVMTNEESDEKEILLLENTNESSQWQQDAQELLPSKLPSANVLLGKQYKIANTVM